MTSDEAMARSAEAIERGEGEVTAERANIQFNAARLWLRIAELRDARHKGTSQRCCDG